jgi:hypothetical protein
VSCAIDRDIDDGFDQTRSVEANLLHDGVDDALASLRAAVTLARLANELRFHEKP